jgi:cytochrome c
MNSESRQRECELRAASASADPIDTRSCFLLLWILKTAAEVEASTAARHGEADVQNVAAALRRIRTRLCRRSDFTMKQTRSMLHIAALAAALLLAGLDTTAAAEPAADTTVHHRRSGVKDAKAMLERAVTYMQDHGAERSFAAFNNQKGSFYTDDLYIFVVGIDDKVMHAHGGAPEALVGLDVRDLRDVTGEPIIQDMLSVAQSGGGTVDYIWLNRSNNRVENKTTLVRQVGRYMIGVGYYTPRSTAEQARELLNLAVAHAQKMHQAAFEAFDDPHGPFVDEDLYVFAVSLDSGKFLAMGANPRMVGSDAEAMHDAAGKPVIADMMALAKSAGSGVVDYVWRNPVTNRVENKHSFIQRVDNYLLGVGYYTP